MAMNALLADLNGTHYLGTQEGETLSRNTANVVVFPHGCPFARNPFEEVVFDADQARDFLRVNVTNLMDEVNALTIHDASVISYHKLLAVKHGLVSPAFLPANFHVIYSEAGQMTDPDTVAKLAHGGTKTSREITDSLTAQDMQDIRETFTDRVCLVAFVFRSRGHHFVPAYQELYQRIWTKCRYANGKLKITFEHMATFALHAVFPIILDDFWTNALANFQCNGALAKRYDGAPAGMAGPAVLKQGIEDLMMIAPGIAGRLEDGLTYIKELEVEATGNRYHGSVNARYYGAKRIVVDEKRLGAIAATIKAAIDALAPDAPIGQSAALARIANNAPLTGAVLGRAIGSISNRNEVIDPLLIAPVHN
jgi:hypothetical protein